MSGPRIVAVEGDITTIAVDAIVNAANSKVRGGGGVDGAIHRAGGPRILEDCRRRFEQGLATGDAGATTAGDLPSRWVIHAVGPDRHRGQVDPALLVSAYRRSLEVAEELGARTVACSLIGAGVYGWSREESVSAALEALETSGRALEEVQLVCFGEAAYDEVAAILNARG
ncbi:MAG: macro domain-containing protein [Nocardioidaceae bacterium]|nr:macro domain-containing protein [Nocardioidaceae bacterium]MCL2614676.1 macro domain-containing protein [Nocardioidaceae bacterium]